LAILVEEPAEAPIRRLAPGVRKVREEMAKVQLELNLHIAKLRLKAQPSTPLEVREQHANVITTGTKEINSVVKNCTKILEESFKVLTTLQEDLNIQCLEIEARELQQRYDDIKGTTQMVVLT